MQLLLQPIEHEPDLCIYLFIIKSSFSRLKSQRIGEAFLVGWQVVAGINIEYLEAMQIALLWKLPQCLAYLRMRGALGDNNR